MIDSTDMFPESNVMRFLTSDLGILRQKIVNASSLDEEVVVQALMQEAKMDGPTLAKVQDLAGKLAQGVRDARIDAGGIDLLTQEFSLDSREGIALMCLAEAMLRIPDTETRNQLIRDKIVDADWRAHIGKSPSLFVNATAWGLLITGKLLKQSDEAALTEALTSVLRKGGEAVVRAGVAYAMRMLGKQFVTGQTIEEAIGAAKARESGGYCYSYDMLGEAALTDEDAQAYFNSYKHAIEAIGCDAKGKGPIDGPGVSVKISGLHPRYELAQRERVIVELYPRLLQLAELAKHYQIGFHLDQEESARFDLTLEMLERLCNEPSLRGWNGIGISLQAYQKRGRAVAEWIIALARATGRRINIRLVKGAYWDTEIKLAQDAGTTGYPVFTRKVHSDVSYLACAKALLAAPDAIFPQFATHNAYSIAAAYTLAGNQDYEFQCLHGMGETVYDQVVGKSKLGRACRIYAPVGPHATLLAYLVRRLLENGANSSFVNQIVDEEVSIADIVEDPVARAARTGGRSHGGIVMPTGVLPGRTNAKALSFDQSNEFGVSLAQLRANKVVARPVVGGIQDVQSDATTLVYSASDSSEIIGTVASCRMDAVASALSVAMPAAAQWRLQSHSARASYLDAAADALEKNSTRLGALLVLESGATLTEAADEVRKAVNIARLYAYQLRSDSRLEPVEALGVVVSVTPATSPLSTFVGQVAAAIAVGNVVIAKPSSSASLIAHETVRLFQSAGIPDGVVQLILGQGEGVGRALIADRRVMAVLFSGSAATRKAIAISLAEARHRPKFIAMSSSVGAMIVDSSALPEQVISDAMVSAFRSAGQLASSLRILCLQDSTSETVLRMLAGMLSERKIGNPLDSATDIGPVSTSRVRDDVETYLAQMRRYGFNVIRAPLSSDCGKGNFVSPSIVDLGELDALSNFDPTVVGPVLHVVRWKTGEMDALVEKLNSIGCSAIGLHTRINEAAGKLLSQAHANSVCINRAMHNALIGMQPYGGAGASGTGPMMGGPLTLFALTRNTPDTFSAPKGPFAPSPQLNSEKFYEFPVQGEHGKFMSRRNGAQRSKELSLSRMDALASLASNRSSASVEAIAAIRRKFSELITRTVPLGLPALTGEENTVELVPRGQVLCAGESLNAVIAQAIAATAFGNEVILLKSPFASDVASRLGGMCRVVDTTDEVRAIRGDFAGVSPDVALAETGHASLELIKRTVAATGRTLSTPDSHGMYDWTQLVRERVTTVNASAAGGNTQLMVLEEDFA
ncbi:proline dehydrogenase/pyrroline-5-carboxylate dehydrogenase [Pandoraea terrae]|uniref:Bifunctional protein PutA n=1 Tax=Pandoraea terrae TaxID=1537710 RepID=A0A5E4UZM1_9BURK|nr:bifunctional proline dehydrogenase/L-glutamate gamma-semialdehyde dehydrogenase PutA [Pandoraea terrae]VVE04993.1 proline dehydrogenase/pyrroline-5-carboxylate dehydrogenase [Pandoraea terrae]